MVFALLQSYVLRERVAMLPLDLMQTSAKAGVGMKQERTLFAQYKAVISSADALVIDVAGNDNEVCIKQEVCELEVSMRRRWL